MLHQGGRRTRVLCCPARGPGGQLRECKNLAQRPLSRHQLQHMASCPPPHRPQDDYPQQSDKRSSGLFLRPEHQLQRALESLPEAIDDARYALRCAQNVLGNELDIAALQRTSATAWGSLRAVVALIESALEAQLLVLSGITRSSASCEQDGQGPEPVAGMLLEKLDESQVLADLLTRLERQVADGNSLSNAVEQVQLRGAQAAGELATLLVGVDEAAQKAQQGSPGAVQLVAHLARVLRRAMKPAKRLGYSWQLIEATYARRYPAKQRAVAQ